MKKGVKMGVFLQPTSEGKEVEVGPLPSHWLRLPAPSSSVSVLSLSRVTRAVVAPVHGPSRRREEGPRPTPPGPTRVPRLPPSVDSVGVAETYRTRKSYTSSRPMMFDHF